MKNIQNLVHIDGGNNVIFQSRMTLQPPFDDGGVGLIENLDERLYLVNDAQHFYEAEHKLYLPQSFVRGFWDIRTKHAMFKISRTEFPGSWPYYLEHDGTLTEHQPKWNKDEQWNFPISFTFEEYIGLMTGKTVTSGKPRTRKKFYMEICKNVH